MIYIIYQTAFIGDIVLVSSMAATIRLLEPRSRIIFITTPAGRTILANNRKINEIIVYDKKNQHRGITGLFNTAGRVKEVLQGEDSVYISPHRFARASILGRLIGSRIRAGFTGSSLSVFYNKKAKYKSGIHEIERNHDLLRAAGIKTGNTTPCKPELFPSEADYLRVKSVINKNHHDNPIAVAPGSVWPTKRWPSEYFAELISLIHKQGMSVILIGSEADRELCEGLASEGDLCLAGRLSILESAVAISLSRALVTNDSAPLHFASAMNVPTVAIFGATTPHLGFGPLADKSAVIENSEAVCRPCGRHGGKKCAQKHFMCMKGITPEAVFRELLKIV